MESKDKFEQFVEQHKEGFAPDHHFPDVWDRIEKIPEPTVSTGFNWNLWLSRAAAFLVIFTLSYFFHDYVSSRQEAGSDVSMANSEALQELYEADKYYSAQVSQRKEELFQLAGASSALRNDVNNELADLDKVLAELKNDLKDNADNAEVIEAMMQNYRLKLEILEDLLTQVKNTNNQKKQHEKGISI